MNSFLSIYLFYFIIVYFSNFRGGKNRGSMDLVHDRGSMDPVHISVDPVHAPRYTEGVHGPGVHVLYFPLSICTCMYLHQAVVSFSSEKLCLPSPKVAFVS